MCNFCNDAVNFVICRDAENRFKFAPLQSDIGLELRTKYNIGDDVDSTVLIEDGNAFIKSSAALRIAKGLGGIWSLAYVFIIVPPIIRDFLYELFARNRYRIFGQRDSCMIPTPDIRARFL